MIRNKIFLMALSCGLFACASVPKKPTQIDYDFYLTNMQVSNIPREYQHSVHGKVLNNKPPLVEDIHSCMVSSYQGVSVTFGNKTVNDPLILKQIEADAMYFTVRDFLRYEKNSVMDIVLRLLVSRSKDGASAKMYEEAQSRIFLDPNTRPLIKDLDAAAERDKACLKNKGWLTSAEVKQQSNGQQ